MEEPRVLTVDGGRRVAVRSAGGPSERAVYVIDGTPSGGLLDPPFVAAAAVHGLRCVTHARPGYGDSTRMPGRSVADVAADVRSIADALGLRAIHVVGWSGGGPHALACAALLPGLVRSAATLAGVAPWGAAGLAWLEGMGPENVEEFGAALEGEGPLAHLLQAQRPALANVTGTELAAALGGLVRDVDVAALRGASGGWIASSFREAVRAGVWGWVDDDLAFTRPWGFELDAIAVPVTVWQGDLDLMVPFAHGEWLADAIPGAERRLVAGEGHISLVADRVDEIVDDLLANA